MTNNIIITITIKEPSRISSEIHVDNMILNEFQNLVSVNSIWNILFFIHLLPFISTTLYIINPCETNQLMIIALLICILCIKSTKIKHRVFYYFILNISRAKLYRELFMGGLNFK